MTTPVSSPDGLFDVFPEPVLLLDGHRLDYYNSVAAGLFPCLAEGVLPELLTQQEDLLDEGTGLLTGRAEGRDWRVSFQPSPWGRLVIFRPVDLPGQHYRAERLAGQLRQQTAGLAAAIQCLFPKWSLTEGKYLQYLTLANQGLYRLMRLVDHLEFLDETEERVYRPQPLDLAGLCQEVAAELEDVSREVGWQFHYDSEESSLILVGDDRLLRRMLMALLSNAIKAAGTGGMFGFKLSRQRGRAVITVWDQGPGLRTSDLSHLLGGEDAKRPGLDPAEGAGLGLPSVRRTVALHGGTIFIDSHVGGGFRMVVSLPMGTPETGLPIRSRYESYASENFSAVLMELSDVLPLSFYAPENER